jgi:hypothetical protein
MKGETQSAAVAAQGQALRANSFKKKILKLNGDC